MATSLLSVAVASAHPLPEDVPEREQMEFIESACDALDSLITTARALR
jgi:hypothetical protein